MSTTKNETTQAPERIIAMQEGFALSAAGDHVEIRESLVGVVAAGNLEANESLILVAATGAIHGDARVLMEAPTAMLFGAALGAALAIVGRLLRRR